MENDNWRGKVGRPPCSVSDLVHAHVARKLAEGTTLAEVARDGLRFYDARGKMVRRLNDKHLEAYFRASERERNIPWLRADSRYDHAWPTFMGRLLPVPFGAAMPSERKRGRPKKNRSR